MVWFWAVQVRPLTLSFRGINWDILMPTDGRSVLERYPRAMVHLHSRRQEDRICLIFGSGVGKPLGFPDWEELVDRLAETNAIEADNLHSSPKTRDPQGSRTQVLFEHFRAKEYEKADPSRHFTADLDREIKRKWQQLVREQLYRDIPDGDNPAADHPYLKAYAPIIRSSPLTINFNFDDTVERMLLAQRADGEKTRSRGFETVWEPSVQWRRQSAVIYHPNGYLPKNPVEPSSDKLTFAEESFADQLIDTAAGHYSSVLHFLSRYTCLLIGLSLEDQTLKHLLRQSAKLNPGHHHYYVSYVGPDEEVSPERRQALRSANFETYNLITLFLDDDDLAEVAKVVHLDSKELKKETERLGVRGKYCSYLTGAIGVGKSTTLRRFRTLEAHDEWFEERHELLGKRFDDLTEEERETVDSWIARQFSMKNATIQNEPLGLHLVDRCPLDPLAFTPEGKWKEKAERLREEIAYEKAEYPIAEGKVIMLKGDPEVMASRNKARFRAEDPEYLREQQDRLLHVYEQANAYILDVREQSVREVVNRVARIIHLRRYEPYELQVVLDDVVRGEVEAP